MQLFPGFLVSRSVSLFTASMADISATLLSLKSMIISFGSFNTSNFSLTAVAEDVIDVNVIVDPNYKVVTDKTSFV